MKEAKDAADKTIQVYYDYGIGPDYRQRYFDTYTT